eukprot:1763029-Pyramimonas_sp.AAC.1
MSYDDHDRAVPPILRLPLGDPLVGEADHAEEFDGVPRGVVLVPLEAVAAGELKRVVVVVPALPKCQDAHPPVIPGQVAGVVLLVPPTVARAVHEPGDVVDQTHSERIRPHKRLPPAERERKQARAHHVPP